MSSLFETTKRSGVALTGIGRDRITGGLKLRPQPVQSVFVADLKLDRETRVWPM